MGHKRHMHPTLKRLPFAATANAAPFPPGTIIAGDDNQRIVEFTALFERGDNAANRVIEPLHHIAVKTGL